ncbi:unnamed protein product [Caenorhabditis sp. 36 PRJEB53466]|nr:unnamed protein product [Caenorhabditis sp. 36 PRJEB53466]
MSDAFAARANERQPDSNYLAALEKRLKAVKDKQKIDSKSILKDIESLKNDQLFKLLSEPTPSLPIEERKFENDFVDEQARLDKPIEPSLIRKKIAPQTCAINKNELASIVKYDLTQKLHESLRNYGNLPMNLNDKSSPEKKMPEMKKKKKRKMGMNRNHAFSCLKRAHDAKKTKWFLKTKRGTSSSIDKCLRAHVLPLNVWEKTGFSSIDQITAVLSFDGNIAMTTDKKCRKSKWKTVNLVSLLPVQSELHGGLFELGCCDLSLEKSGDCLAILAVFWIELSKDNTPFKCFGSVFRITEHLNVIFCDLIPSPSMVACCRLTDRKKFTGHQHCLLVFSKEAQVSAYRVEPTFIRKIEDVFEWFPSLALTNLPGGALRTDCKICKKYRYSAVGLDTGVLIVSVCMIEGNVILDSARLRFAGPLSIVEFLPQVSDNVQRLLLSSFIGPAGIWRLKFADDKLTWETECQFERSQYYDSILCACIYRFYHGSPPVLHLGTYSGRILQYELPPPTKEVRKSLFLVPKYGRPINCLINNAIYFIKQTGFNEISAVTPFGLFVLRENIRGKRRLGKFAAHWLERYQNLLLIKNPGKADDFSKADLRRFSLESIQAAADMLRPRLGSTVSQLTYRCSDDEERMDRRRGTTGAKELRDHASRGATLSVSGSSNGSSSRLRQLDVATTDLYYQDGPLDALSPKSTSPRATTSHESHPQSPLVAGDNRGQPAFFRATNKNLASPQPRVFK